MARIEYASRDAHAEVVVAGLIFPAMTSGKFQYSEAQDDYEWQLGVRVDPLQGVAAAPFLEDGDVVTLTLATGDPLRLPVTPSSPNQFDFRGSGYPPFLPADEPPAGRERPSEDSLRKGREGRSFGYIVRDGRIRGDLLQHISAVLARLEEANPENDWEQEVIAQATVLAKELHQLISSERPAADILANRSHSQRLIGGLMSFARFLEEKGSDALGKIPIVNAVVQLSEKATNINL